MADSNLTKEEFFARFKARIIAVAGEKLDEDAPEIAELSTLLAAAQNGGK